MNTEIGVCERERLEGAESDLVFYLSCPTSGLGCSLPCTLLQNSTSFYKSSDKGLSCSPFSCRIMIFQSSKSSLYHFALLFKRRSLTLFRYLHGSEWDCEMAYAEQFTG